jgi:hypothetical protein
METLLFATLVPQIGEASMIGLRKATGVFVCALVSFAIVGLSTSSVTAGLVGTGLAYNDGTRTWEGTASFNKLVTGGRLQGTVQWAVFTGSNFLSLFPDYAPTPGEMVYAYQVFNVGTVSITKTMAPLLSGATGDNEGSFTSNGMGGVLPFFTQIIPGDVVWNFYNPANPSDYSYSIGHPGQSAGLVFSSNRKPRTEWYVVVDGGGTVNVNGVGGPGAEVIPEPSALALLAVAVSSLGVFLVRPRRRANT